MTLKEYLDRLNMNPKQFAAIAHIADATSYKAYKGEPILKRTAKKIIKATKGSLKMEDLNISLIHDLIRNTDTTRPVEST